MKKVIVCGDSWMSPSVEYPKTHFSELLAEKLNWDLEIYSRGGMSNNGICLQIESAIKENPDFILLDTTENNRIEIQIDQNSNTAWQAFTVEDIIYRHPQSISSSNPKFNKSPRLMIDTIYYFLDNTSNFGKYEDLVPDLDCKRAIIKQWFTDIHSRPWQMKTDKWCLYAVLHQLHESKIPYLIVIDPNQMDTMCPWINEKTYLYPKIVNEITRFQLDLSKEDNWIDPGYHTLPKAQKEIADVVLAHFETFYPTH